MVGISGVPSGPAKADSFCCCSRLSAIFFFIKGSLASYSLEEVSFATVFG